MNAWATSADWERFRVLIADRFGLTFDDAKLGFLGEVLHRRLNALGLGGAAYLDRLQTGTWSDEGDILVQELTVGETYFYRNIAQFQVLSHTILPERAAAPACPGVLRLLSAGCASGEEAFTLAMVARDTVPTASCALDILAVDINPIVLDKARRGRFTAWSLRETPPAAQGRWFQADGRDVILDDGIRQAVRFHQANLIEDDPDLWRPGHYDVIFCRNVLMYFAPGQARAVLACMARSLAPGGYLFLGHAETVRGLSEAFHLCHGDGAFYYRLKADTVSGTAAPVSPILAPLRREPPPRNAAPPDADDAWADVIGAASRRISSLIPAPGTAACRDAATGTPLVPDMAKVLTLLKAERYGEALSHVNEWPREARSSPDALLVEALLLAQSGALAEAENICRQLLNIDEMNAGAHYVLALCREGLDDGGGAAENDRVAIYLDPAFAMPHLHLGLLSRRLGDIGGARRELGQALVLLKREDTARILLFGGGFTREALAALCETALRDCGGAP